MKEIKNIFKYFMKEERFKTIIHIFLLVGCIVCILSVNFLNHKYELNKFNSIDGPSVAHFCEYESNYIIRMDQPSIFEKYCDVCGKTFKEEPRGFVFHQYYCTNCEKSSIGNYCSRCGHIVSDRTRILLSETEFVDINTFIYLDIIYKVSCFLSVFVSIFTISSMTSFILSTLSKYYRTKGREKK